MILSLLERFIFSTINSITCVELRLNGHHLLLFLKRKTLNTLQTKQMYYNILY